MAFLLKRTLGCDYPGCDATLTLVCRDNNALEHEAELRGWYVRPEGDVDKGRWQLFHLCPRHKDDV